MELTHKSIHQAAAQDDTDTLRRLTDQVNTPDPDTEWTPLHYAAEHNALAAAHWLLQNGADPEALAQGVTPLDLTTSEPIRTLLASRIPPLQPKFRVLVPLALALALATLNEDDTETYRTHADYRVRELYSRLQRKPTQTEHHPQQPKSPKDLELIRGNLQDQRLGVRTQGLGHILDEPDERLAADVIPLFSDGSKPLQLIAAQAFRHCATRDPVTLEKVRPQILFARKPKPIPKHATPEQIAAITEENKDRASWDYDARSAAVQALHYQHGDQATQDYLFSLWDDPQRQLKRELNQAFLHCPNPTALQQALLERLDGPDPLTALIALSRFQNPTHKAVFLERLQTDDPELTRAALRGLQPNLNEADLPALRECRDRWR
ncbi:hypothetical protein ABS71_16410 [bacterium SCN 62-11]|nr:ankyrin repeat domain-containing protein [Candidatus Eremiobacteraeota bacterium]ODT61973.1 MAG: hypothetical protein ABS71_16410 [bacterium SCN 62-11]